MRAAVFEGLNRELAVRQWADPSPSVGEVVIRVRRCGICGTDVHLTEEPLNAMTFPAPCVPGHEFAGEVVARGSGSTRLKIGERVSVMPLWSCTACSECRAGRPNRCARLDLIGCGRVAGGYAEYALAKQDFCFRLPDTVGFEEGALAEPLAVAWRGVRMAGVGPSSRVVVLGAGPIAQATAFWLRRRSAQRIGMAAPSRRGEAIATQMGADGFFTIDDGLEEAVSSAFGGPPDIVVECTGRPGLIERAIGLVAVGGTVVVLGFCVGRDSFFPPTALAKEVVVRFSQLYDACDYAHVIETLADGATQLSALVTERVGLDGLPAAFAALRGRTTQCKVMIDPWMISE